MGNGKTFGAANLAAFQEWSDKRTVQNDWERFIRQEKLNRTKIAEDCQFGTAVFGQNPGFPALSRPWRYVFDEKASCHR